MPFFGEQDGNFWAGRVGEFGFGIAGCGIEGGGSVRFGRGWENWFVSFSRFLDILPCKKLINQLDSVGLLLDLDDLLPTTTAASLSSSTYSPPAPSPSTPEFRPLPENPHALVDVSAPTFPLAVSMYRTQLVDLATNHSRRSEMGKLAALNAASRSWHGAMEMLVDGYREICRPEVEEEEEEGEREKGEKVGLGLGLSRTSTIEVDVVSHLAERDNYDESRTSGSSRVGRVLRLGGVFRRTGGRLKDGSMSIKGKFLWRGQNKEGKKTTTTTKMIGGENEMEMQMQGGLLVTRKVQSNQVWVTREFLIFFPLCSFRFVGTELMN